MHIVFELKRTITKWEYQFYITKINQNNYSICSMKWLFGNCLNILNPATNHFIPPLEVSKKWYFWLTELGQLTDVGLGVVTMVNLH